jgi:hypothetical protein
MRKAGFSILTGLLLILFSVNLFSQDLIVTNDNDSIRCKILGIKGNDMLFDYPDQDGTNSSRISLSKMKYYKYGYYKISKPKPVLAGPAKVRFGINGGYSYRTAPTVEGIPSSLTSYIESLKSGYHYGMDFMYFFNDYLGMGLKASKFRSGKKETEGGNIHDDISIGFVGPEFCTRLPSRNSLSALFVAIAIGYSGYKDDGYYNYPILIKGNTMGMGMDLGYDIGLSKNWAIGFQLSALFGTITEIDVTQGSQTLHVELEKDNYESLARVDLSVGLRCRF